MKGMEAGSNSRRSLDFKGWGRRFSFGKHTHGAKDAVINCSNLVQDYPTTVAAALLGSSREMIFCHNMEQDRNYFNDRTFSTIQENDNDCYVTLKPSPCSTDSHQRSDEFAKPQTSSKHNSVSPLKKISTRSAVNILISPVATKFRNKRSSGIVTKRKSDEVHSKKKRRIFLPETDQLKKSQGILRDETSFCPSYHSTKRRRFSIPIEYGKEVTKAGQRKTNFDHEFKSSVASDILTIDIVLQNKVLLRDFKGFLAKEHSGENLDFWLECDAYKMQKKSSKQRSLAAKIYHEFVKDTAPRQINVDFRIKEEIRTRLSKPDISIFYSAQNHVYGLMKNDSFPRFIQSLECI